MGQAWMKPNTNALSFSERSSGRGEPRSRGVPPAICRPRPSPSLLLIHANDRYCAALAANLRAQELSVIEFDDPRAALLYVMNDGWVNAVLIDADLPKVSGIDLLLRLRSLETMPPAAMAAAACDEAVEETALEYGAADFLDKSRSPSIGAKRVRLLMGGGKFLPVPEKPPRQIVSIGDLDLKLQSHRAYWRKLLVPLTVTEFKIVRLLTCRAGEEVSYREIYDVVHGAGFVAGDGHHGYRSNVRSLIRKIRNRFRMIDETFAEIENYPGFGYRWRGTSHGETIQAIPHATAAEMPTPRQGMDVQPAPFLALMR